MNEAEATVLHGEVNVNGERIVAYTVTNEGARESHTGTMYAFEVTGRDRRGYPYTWAWDEIVVNATMPALVTRVMAELELRGV